MNSAQARLAKILTYAGTLPLIGAVANEYLAIIPLNNFAIAQTYAAIIIAFLSGIHWAVFLYFSEKCPRNLLITSNITALLAWVALLYPPSALSFLLLTGCFLYLWVLDLRLLMAALLPPWFYQLRRNASLIVVLSVIGLLGAIK